MSDFHGHRPAVGSNQRLFWSPMSVDLVAVARRLVHPTAPVLLTKIGPLGTQVIQGPRLQTSRASRGSHPFKV